MHAGVLPASWGSVDAFPQLTTLIISNTNITGRFSTLQIHALVTVYLGVLSFHKLLWVPYTQQWISAASGSAEASCKEITTGDLLLARNLEIFQKLQIGCASLFMYL